MLSESRGLLKASQSAEAPASFRRIRTFQAQRPKAVTTTDDRLMQSPERSLQLFYFDAGGGHRNAATALKESANAQFPEWTIELVNLQELLRPHDPIFILSGRKRSAESVYNDLLKHGWTLGSGGMLRGLQGAIALQAPTIEKALREHWKANTPDLVVSLIPNFNKPLFRSLKAVSPSTPYVTVMTDIADTPPHFWQERQPQYLITGSLRASEQAAEKGYTEGTVFQVSGMILKSAFYNVPIIDKKAERIKLGLDPECPTAIIMFGGNGSKISAKIVKKLEKAPVSVQSIVMCGHDNKLFDRLSGRPGVHAVGFTTDVPHYMSIADFFVGKPGPGSISEALKIGLPVVLERNAHTMPQERYNTNWVRQENVGIVLKDFSKINRAVRTLYREGALEVFQRNARAINNVAVFEIPPILDFIIDQGPARGGFPKARGMKSSKLVP